MSVFSLLALQVVLAAVPRPQVLEKRLPNGVQVVVVPRGNVPWCAITTVLPGGSREDPAGMGGLAHLAEHLLFEEKHGGSDEDAEALGMRSNAFTLTDYTIVVDEFSPAVLEEAVTIHAARLKTGSFTLEQLEREKRVVLDERRYRVDENPLGTAEEILLENLWKGHVWGRPVLGSAADVKAIPAGAVTSWMHARVRPERAAVVLVGAVDGARAMAALEAALATWKAEEPLVLAAPPAEPAPGGKTLLRLTGSTNAVMTAFPAAALHSPHAATDALLAQLLSGDVASRLQGEPLDLPPLDLVAEHRAQAHLGEFLVTVSPHGLMPPEDAAMVVDVSLRALSQQGPSQDAVDQMRARILADAARGDELHSGLAERLAVDLAVQGDLQAQEGRRHDLEAVTVDMVRERAAWMLRQPRRSTVLVRSMDAP